jgi:hypothetical protein
MTPGKFLELSCGPAFNGSVRLGDMNEFHAIARTRCAGRLALRHAFPATLVAKIGWAGTVPRNVQIAFCFQCVNQAHDRGLRLAWLACRNVGG